jgi:hypothetical protein
MDASVEDTAVADTAIAAMQDTAAPPIPDGGFPLDDGGSACDKLAAKVAMYQAVAQACTPNSTQQQCTAQATGTCCPIAVDTGANPGDIQNYEIAVMNYVTTCKPKCSLPNCPPLISGQCVGGGTVGTCQ